MIHYLKGDATVPQAKGPKLIVHICNTLGGWGAGFVLAISKRWAGPERWYREWHRVKKWSVMTTKLTGDKIMLMTGDFALGAAQIIQVSPDTYVVNMIAQQGMKTGSNGPPIRYDALEKCLGHVNGYADSFKASVHMPRIGCSLGGGRWERVEPLLQSALSGREVYVYDF